MKVITTTLNAKYIHTNLALRFLKAYSAPEFHIEIIEYTIKDPILHVVADLFQQNPDVIGFSCYIWNIKETKKIAALLKKALPNCKIIFGGPEVSFNAESILNEVPAVDAIVIGEGEATFKELLQKLTNHEPINEVNGLAYQTNEGIVVNSPREKLDLMTIPSPYRFAEDLANLPHRISYFETSRGCPFNCQFCLSSTEVGVRYFDREEAKADLLYLIQNGVKTIKFMDRTFNTNREFALDIFDFLIKNHTPGMSIQFEITADIMRPEIIAYLNEHAPAGLFRFEIGIQSTNENTNLLVQRKQNFEKLKRIVTMIKEGGKIDQHLDLIAGLPEEDYSSFRSTFNDVFEMRPEELQLGFLKMLHGTGLTKDAEKFGYQYMEHAPYEMLSNNCLSFTDVIHIKQVEDILEKYWNAHRMDLTIEYLVTNVFASAFDFFQGFGAYWVAQDWSKIGHQLADLFIRLAEYLEKEQPEHYLIALNLMKYDYLTRLTHKPRSIWWEDDISKDKKNELLEQLIGPAQNTRDLQKHGLFVHFNINIEKFLTEHKIEHNHHWRYVYFDPKHKNVSLKSIN